VSKLKPWYHVIQPREDLREDKPLDASEFAVHLDHVRENRAPAVYVEPERFFDRTYLTRSLLDLCAVAVRRLSGIQVETSAVFNMSTQFGGGKTHALTALFHLARGGVRAHGWKGVRTILERAQVEAIPQAEVAVFVGTEFDPLRGRGGEGEPLRKTPWGEIAWQLGRETAFAVVAEHDARGVAPAGDVIRRMLPARPCLVLLDELLNFVSRARKLGLRDQLFDFIQSLSEEARARKDLVLCVSIPASELEMSPEDQRDHEALKKLLDRVGKAIMMSAESEVAEIIRRRLFEWETIQPDEMRRTARAYADWVAEHEPEIAGFSTEGGYELFLACYPFHPTLLSVFERKWQSLPRFQRTRGVLRLLALWVADRYREDHRRTFKDALIGEGTAPLDDPMFRAALFEQLGSDQLEVPVTTDIAGKPDAHAVRLDREAQESIRKARLHQKLATAIFLESNGGMSAAKAEASLAELKAAVGEPELNLGEVDQALEGLSATAFYLRGDHNRYRFSSSPNLNQILVSRRGGVSQSQIDERIRKETEAVFGQGTSPIEQRFFPSKSADVPDRPQLVLVVLGCELPARELATERFVEALVREHGSAARTFKSGLLVAAAEGVGPMADAARTVLAWEDIDDDDETKARLDDTQRKQLYTARERARADLREAVFRTYHLVYLLDKTSKMQLVDLGKITSSMGRLKEMIQAELENRDEITKGFGAHKLVGVWPPALTEWSTKAVRDAFFASPRLPRLLQGDAIRRTIAEGVSQGLLGYARKDGAGKLHLECFEQPLAEAAVEISEDLYVLKAEDARKILEPPRLVSLDLSPSPVTVQPGDQIALKLRGVDQYGHEIVTSPASWEVLGGEMLAGQIFAAGTAPGRFHVTARVDGLAAEAVIFISKRADSSVPSATTGFIRWRGTVPYQKWMTFYTKVLSRFASNPGLTVEVEFRVPKEGGAGSVGETQSALRDLGLSDDVDTE
jgi:hypothetical protein